MLKRKKYSHLNLLYNLRLGPEDRLNYLRYTYNIIILIHLFRVIQLSNSVDNEKKYIKNTHLREVIFSHERLTVTLRYLATSRSYEDLKSRLKFTAVITAQSYAVSRIFFIH